MLRIYTCNLRHEQILNCITLIFTFENRQYFPKFRIFNILDRQGIKIKIFGNIVVMNKWANFMVRNFQEPIKPKIGLGGGIEFLAIFEGYIKLQPMCLLCAIPIKI